MNDRVVDISDEPARLSIRFDQLVIRREGPDVTVPLEDIAALVISHPAVVYTQAVLTGVCSHGGACVLCDSRRLPIAMLLPLQAHFVQTERLAAQVEASAPLKKQLWKQIVKAKVLAQAKALQRVRGHDAGLAVLAKSIRSGDPDNIEAQASRRYWPALFGPDFRRIPMGDGTNSLLNYGYAVLRAMVARAICSSGLHPSLGVHHHNRYDAFCLADDLMEPYRPLVDEIVAALVDGADATPSLDKTTKTALISGLAVRRFDYERESRTLFDLIASSASSLVQAYQGKRTKLLLPVL